MEIKSSVRTYHVQFTPDFAEVLKQSAKLPQGFAVVDANVYRLYRELFETHLKLPLLQIEATEENKSYERAGEFMRRLLHMGVRKSTHLIVVGGGVVQDIGGFMASVLFRGIEYTLVPTTMLAQCDSCIGSKTSMNLSGFKNQLGTFYPPTRVLVSSSVLGTLAERDLKSGICEALKLAMIDGLQACAQMTTTLKAGLSQQALQDVVQQALEIKKVFIEEDEFDKGRRNLLNFGHTFAHAFESQSNYRIPHGMAVGLGIMAANFFSLRTGMLTEAECNEARDLIQPWCGEFFSELKKLDPDSLIKAMKSDKKSAGDRIGFILTRGFGKMERASLPFEESRRLLGEWLDALEI